jgi:hypothetical protein
MFPVGFFTIPFGVTGIAIADPATPAQLGESSLVVSGEGGRVKRIRSDTDQIVITEEPYTVVLSVPPPLPVDYSLSLFTRWHRDYAGQNNGVWRDAASLDVIGTARTASGQPCTKLTHILMNPPQDAWFADGAASWTTFISPITVGATAFGSLYGLSLPIGSRCVLWSAHSNLFVNDQDDWAFIAWRTTSLATDAVFLAKGYLPTAAVPFDAPDGVDMDRGRCWALTRTNFTEDGIADVDARFKMVFWADGETYTQGYQFVLPDLPTTRVRNYPSWFMVLYIGTTHMKISVQGSPLIVCTYATDLVPRKDTVTEQPTTLHDIGIGDGPDYNVPQTMFGAFYADGTKPVTTTANSLMFCSIHRGNLHENVAMSMLNYMRSRQAASFHW